MTLSPVGKPEPSTLAARRVDIFAQIDGVVVAVSRRLAGLRCSSSAVLDAIGIDQEGAETRRASARHRSPPGRPEAAEVDEAVGSHDVRQCRRSKLTGALSASALRGKQLDGEVVDDTDVVGARRVQRPTQARAACGRILDRVAGHEQMRRIEADPVAQGIDAAAGSNRAAGICRCRPEQRPSLMVLASTTMTR